MPLRWMVPYSTAGPRGHLDRVAHIAERKYCCPHARDRSAFREYYDSMRVPQPRVQRELGFDLLGFQRRCGCNECLQNMTSGKCQKTSDTSSRLHDHTPARQSKCWRVS